MSVCVVDMLHELGHAGFVDVCECGCACACACGVAVEEEKGFYCIGNGKCLVGGV